MTEQSPVADVFDDVLSPHEVVTFTVLCKPASGITLTEFRRQLARSSLEGLLPTEETRQNVVSQLQTNGFEVIEIGGLVPNPVVFARGTVQRFREIFGGDLVRLTRHVLRDSDRSETMTAVVFRPGSEPTSFDRVDGVFLVTMAEPPQLASFPSPPAGSNAPRPWRLHLPAGVARTTRAASTHRRLTPSGDPATGRGVVVAVIDTGFAKHPYFTQRPYRIKRLAAPDADSPEIDDHRHGTAVLANLVACAPEADVYAIKFDRMDWAVAFALAIPDVRVISLSWVYEQPFALPEWMLVLEFLIVFAVVTRGVTVIAATGFGNMGETCPANMPTVISVGGVSIFVGSRTAWDQTASFQSKAFRGRNAPDLCGVASQIRVPMPPVKKGGRYGWELRSGGTSCAAPQVAGIAALLIQKNRSLTPDDIRRVLVSNGTDIRLGVTFAKDAAVAGPDLATGGGLVNALKAWLCV